MREQREAGERSGSSTGGFQLLLGVRTPPCTPVLSQICCILNPTRFVPDRAEQEDPALLLKPQTSWGFCLDFGVDGFPVGQRSPPRSFRGGRAKADFTPKTESTETHGVIYFFPRESVKRIAISPLASMGRVAGVYCGKIKLSERHRERQRIMRTHPLSL